MNDSAQTPDRRPLVYGVFAVAILVAAAFLFWPHGEKNVDMVLTPESVRGVAAGEENGALGGGALDEAGMGQMSTATDALDATADAAATELDADAGPAAETHIDGAPTQTSHATTSTVTAPKTSTSSPAPKTATPTTPSRTPQRTNEISSPLQPASTGDWVLNVGAFSTRSNADKQVQQLAKLGVNAQVQTTSKDDGSPLYRVRVGYFPTSDAAKSYGAWLKKSQNLDSWAARR